MEPTIQQRTAQINNEIRELEEEFINKQKYKVTIDSETYWVNCPIKFKTKRETIAKLLVGISFFVQALEELEDEELDTGSLGDLIEAKRILQEKIDSLSTGKGWKD